MPDAATAEGARSARERVAASLAGLEHIDVEVVVVARPDAERRTAIARARDAARGAGRGPLLDEATAAARDLAIRAFSLRGFSGTWAAADWSISTSGPRDRAAVGVAFEEAVTAAVVEDLVDEETLAVLHATSNELAMMTGTPSPGALSNVGRPIVASGSAAVAVAVGAVAVGVAIGSVAGGTVGLLVAAAVIGLVARRRAGLSPR